MGRRNLADQQTAALTGPLLFAHFGNRVPEAVRHYPLNPGETCREESQRNAQRRADYRLGRLLWRTGAHFFCHQTGTELPDADHLPAWGAPRIPGQSFDAGLSHTDGVQVAAFHHDCLGVDVESSSRSIPWQRLAVRWFTKTENEWLQQSRSAARRFLFLWTLKEAWVKATGRGIAGNLQALSLAPRSQGARFRIDRQEPEWHAASTLVDSFRISIIWHGQGAPDWWDVALPGGKAGPERILDWTELELTP